MTVKAFTPAAKPQAPNGYRMLNKGDRGEIYLYGVIGGDWFGGGVTAKQFADDLKRLGNIKQIDVRINSEGGDVFDGKAIYSLLVEHKANVTVHVDGLAASAASFIAMAGNTIEIAEGAFMMIHRAWGVAIGNVDEMRRYADLLDTVDGTIRDVYAARTKQSADDIKAWMDAETWFTAKEAVENGFADRMVENMKVAACVSDPSRYKRLPAALMPKRAAALSMIEQMRKRV